jgi:putative transposase
MTKAATTASEQTVLEVVENVQAILWGRIEAGVRKLVKTLVEQSLEGQATEATGAERHERTPHRRHYRGGHYRRQLLTKHGAIQVRVPRLAGERLRFCAFDRYERRRRDVDAIIGRLFIAGVSTRKLRGIVEALTGATVSASTVSAITRSLDEELAYYRSKPVPADIRFLFLDGITQKVQELGAEKKVVLCALGVREDGSKDLLGFQLADDEGTSSWRGFLADLKARGLGGQTPAASAGQALQLIIIDGGPGLRAALKEIFPFVRVQRCIVHKVRNVLAKLRARNKKAFAQDMRAIWTARRKREALAAFRALKARWWVEEERAVRCLEKDLPACLVYLRFPPELHKAIRTTNLVERMFREVRRRTRPMGVFANVESAERIMMGIGQQLNDAWRPAPHPVGISAEPLA